MIGRALLVAAVVFVPLVLVVNLAVEAVPHARGIAYVPALRYAVVTPLAAIVALLAAFARLALAERVSSPSTAFTMGVALSAALLVALLAVAGAPGIVRAGAPAVVAGALVVVVLVPRFVVQLPGLGASFALAILGLVELAGLRAAVASEPAPEAPTSSGFAFDVPRALFDVEHRRIDLPGARAVHYIDEGEGPILLFLHGNPSWSFQWRDLVARLRTHHRCVALDYPGFGLSPAPTGYGYTAREQSQIVEQLVDALGLRDVTLVMQDWGGPIGLAFAGRRPSLVRAIVAGNTWAWPTTTSEPRGKFSRLVGGPLGEIAQMNFNAFASFGLRHGVKHELPADVLATYLRPFAPLSGRGVAAFYPGQIVDAADFLREVEAGLPKLAEKPALLFWGMLDAGFPRRDLERMQAAFPDHRTIELPAADHFFFEDSLETMVPAIESFVASGSAAR